MNARSTRRARLATLTSAALLSLTLGVGGQLLSVDSAAAAGADDTARLPHVAVARPQVEITGTISALGSGSVTVAGKTITLAGAEHQLPLQLGATVKVHATVTANASLTAREVRMIARPATPATPAAPATPATHDATDDH